MKKMDSCKIKVKAPAKINLHLEVIGRRTDGFHELSMIMQAIDLCDFLELKNRSNGELNLISDSIELGKNEDNLIIKAGKLLKEFSNKKELGADIYLNKNIPIGAGLAGGSSDAAAALLGLNKLWNLNLNSYTLHKLACEIGSDVPFCLGGGSQFCFGRGEILEKYKSDINYSLMLIKDPNISISTAEVYKKYSSTYKNTFTSSRTEIMKRRNLLRLKGFDKDKVFNTKVSIRNDLQKIVEKENNSVKEALNLLSSLNNCLTFSMSGSGPSCFGIFEDYNKAQIQYQKNIESFKKGGFDVWICNFVDNGVTII